MIDSLLAQVASYPVLFVLCAASGILPMPEDVAVLAAGVAAAGGDAALPAVLAVAMAGVLLRDLLFYGAGRFFGEAVLTRPLVKRLIGEKRIERARQMVTDRGPAALLAGRFMIGFRTPVFLIAGALGMRKRDFLMWDMAGLVVMVPGMMMIGYFMGEPALTGIRGVFG